MATPTGFGSIGNKFAKVAATGGGIKAGAQMGRLAAFTKVHPVMTGMGGTAGVMLLASMIASRLLDFHQQRSENRMQRDAMDQQMAQSPDNMYYQAMAGNLGQERQQAQNALLQAIMGGRGQAPPVKGERAVGGGGQGGGGQGGGGQGGGGLYRGF